MKNAIIVLVLFIFMGCSENNYESNLENLDAIYIMDADGDNKQRVLTVIGCTNVQFIPNTNRILFMTLRNDDSYMQQIYTVNIYASELSHISDDYLLKDDQPAISNDGSKIVFWALHESRDTDYDLYMTDPLGSEIINLTNTEDVSEKDASFINYQDQEYLLYVTYFIEDNLNYSTISIMNTGTFETDTLYVEGIEDEHGFKKPIYDNINDILFTIFDYYSILEYSSLENGESTFISYCDLSTMGLSIMNTQLLFSLNGINKYDYSSNQIEVNFLVDGYKFDTFNEKVIYCTSSQTTDGDTYSIELDGSNKTMLAEDGFYPRFSEGGYQIVYIGKYLIDFENKSGRIF